MRTGGLHRRRVRACGTIELRGTGGSIRKRAEELRKTGVARAENSPEITRRGIHPESRHKLGTGGHDVVRRRDDALHGLCEVELRLEDVEFLRLAMLLPEFCLFEMLRVLGFIRERDFIKRLVPKEREIRDRNFLEDGISSAYKRRFGGNDFF